MSSLQPAEVRDIDVATIDGLVREGAWLNTWPPAITALYGAASDEALRREFIFLHVLGCVVCFATIALDLVANRGIVEQGVVLRACLVGPVVLFGLLVWTRKWSAWMRPSLAAGPIAFVAVLSSLALQLPPNEATAYMMGAGIVLGIGNVSQPFAIRGLVLFALTGIAAGIGGIALGGTQAVMDHTASLLALVLIALATLPLAVRIERLRRQNFLLNLRTQLVSAQLVEANSSLRRLSDTDALTGVGNRRWFEYMFDQRIMPGEGTGVVGLMMIDLDHFKAFNDRHGHQAGDCCLRMVAGTLKDVFDEAGGIFARYGGEEFIAALRGDDATVAVALAETARARVAATLAPVTNGERALITASIGVAVAPISAGFPREELIEMADAALYSGKNAGRNRVELVEAMPITGRDLRVETLG